MRDRNQETDSPAYENTKSVRSMTLRDRLEIRKVNCKDRIEQLQSELSGIEDGLKLLNKNKELETLVNLIQL